MVETITFVVAAGIILGGAIGVIISRNPVHAALSLVATLFGVAVLFVAQDAQLLAAVQVIVYTGAIVVLILFVIMLLGVDRLEDVSIEPLRFQRPLAALVGVGLLGLTGAMIWLADGDADRFVTGAAQPCSIASAPEPGDPPCEPGTRALRDDESNIAQVGRVLFTDYVFAFEVTAGLLTIAVIGAVVMARRPSSYQDLPEHPDDSKIEEDPDPQGGHEADEGVAR